MYILWQVVFLLLFFLRLFLLGRLVMDIVRAFARRWYPTGAAAIVVELVYTMTDPPMKMLRRVLPNVRLGGVSFDLSILILLVLINILMAVVGGLLP